MSVVVSIVEGDGEVSALPVLLRRVSAWRSPGLYFEFSRPIRVRRDRFINREEEFRRHVLFAGTRAGEDGLVLILLDADDDCPAVAGSQLLNRARELLPDRYVAVVFANREFEAWYLGSAESLQGHRGLNLSPEDLQVDAERPRDAKGWLSVRMEGRRYGETTDQPAFAALMDLQQAFDRCRSFRKLCSDWDSWALFRPMP